LPNEKFEVKMHCFDTKVYETTIESRRLYGFGGTSFDIIEDYIQSYIKKNNLKYPEGVCEICKSISFTRKTGGSKRYT
jgi:hypothetical protein